MHKIILITFLALLLGSCANKDARLVGDTSNIYPGGLFGQRINGDDNSVSIIKKCIIENIPKYDDLRSDAKNIAESMKQICTSQHPRLAFHK